MQITMKMAHDEDQAHRETAVHLLQYLASTMGEEICQCFIVPEIRSLCIESSPSVRIAVSKALLSISKIVKPIFFSQNIYPLYKELSSDREDSVRKACAEQVSGISEVAPNVHKETDLRELYYTFIKDKTSKLVRGTAYQSVG
jgi:hypothetical protein